MSRFVLDSNNLWLVAFSDGTMHIYESPVQPDLNTHSVPYNFTQWKQAARIGTIAGSTHRELEVFGVVLGAQKLAELNKVIADHQAPVNREGFMFTWFNVRSTDRNQTAKTVMRRLNDLFDWSKYGVEVPVPVETDWDRFQIDTGKLMVQGSGQLRKEMEEKEAENQRLQAEKDKVIVELINKQAEEKEAGEIAAKEENERLRNENEELKKQVEEKEGEENAAKEENERVRAENEELKKQVEEKDDQLAAVDKEKEAETETKAAEIEELKKQVQEKDDQLAAKDKKIASLKRALQELL